MRKMIKNALLLFMLVSMFSQTALAENFDYTIEQKERVPIPRTYEVTDVIYNIGEAGFLNQAEDIFVDKNNYIYIADTGNSRIVILDPNGDFYRMHTGDNLRAFNKPTGVFVDDDGDIYVADTGNSRVCHMTADGIWVEDFIRPESELLDENFTFTPNKIYVNNTGVLYVIKGQNFISIDANNNFQGYVGQTEVGFDFRRMLIRMFATQAQKDKTAKVLPESYSNFVIDNNGMIYATTLGKENQIRKINSVGTNIYNKDVYGEPVIDEVTGLTGDPYFVDIAVDDNGIITALEQKGGKLYQYDQEGNLLTVFGGKGSWKGVFDLPSSLAVDSNGKVYVLDRTLNNIQVFTPTLFANLVKTAVTDYANGDYAKTLEVWQEVLKIDANYSLAHRGIGKVYIKEMRWAEAMKEYRLVEARAGYSDAYGDFLHELFRAHFGLVVLIIAVALVLIIFIYSKLKKYADKVLKEEIEV